jgi:hypothetical protein
VAARRPSGGSGADVLAAWAEGLGGHRGGAQARGCLRFAFYGRVSTEEWQDPESPRARQLQQSREIRLALLPFLIAAKKQQKVAP